MFKAFLNQYRIPATKHRIKPNTDSQDYYWKTLPCIISIYDTAYLKLLFSNTYANSRNSTSKECKSIWYSQKTGGSVFLYTWAKYLAIRIQHQSQIKTLKKIKKIKTRVNIKEYHFNSYREHIANITMACFWKSLFCNSLLLCHLAWTEKKLCSLFSVLLIR